MAAKLEATRTPGVYRRGSRYAVIYRDGDGRQRQASARTYDEARRLRSSLIGQVADGSHVAPNRETIAAYGRRWIEQRQRIREGTRKDYRRDLERYVVPYLGSKRVTALRRADVKAFVAWLADDDAQRDRHRRENVQRARDGKASLREPGPLRDGTVARIVAVLSGCMTGAVDDEIRKDNPVARVALPRRDGLPSLNDGDQDGRVKAMTREQVAAFLPLVRPEWRVFFRLLAATGLRVGEALALADDHLVLDGSRPVVKVRRAVDKSGRTIDRPKSHHGVRDVPLPHSLVTELRAHLAARTPASADAVARYGRLVFPSATGTPMAQNNLRRRVLEPAAQEADVSWIGFHAFRHTFASLHIEAGTNIVRLSRLIGHHKPSFTLDVYGHLLDDGLGAPLDLDRELGGGMPGSSRSTEPKGIRVDPALESVAKSAREARRKTEGGTSVRPTTR